ncbi:MAG: hypothetical protein H6981_11350 [Gammaproteobacteria bacterium]|nr:hypothetical protein [Gammaproteobacteria bacterium]
MMRTLLYRLTSNRPCRLITIDEKPYLERYFLARFWGLTIYLHRFVSSDDERAVHDHPWSWSAALILAGGYREERLKHFDPETGWASQWRRLFPGRINWINTRAFHRITAPKPNTWTLFIHGPRVKSWGFLEKTERGLEYLLPQKCVGQRNWWETAPRGELAGRVPYAQ